MTTLTPPPTFSHPVATPSHVMTALKRLSSYSNELSDDIEEATAYQLSVKDNGKLMASQEKHPNMNFASVDEAQFDKLMRSGMQEPDTEHVHGVQVGAQQDSHDDTESTNEQKSPGAALTAAVNHGTAPRFRVKKLLSLMKRINGYRRINDKVSSGEVDRNNRMRRSQSCSFEGNTVAVCEGPNIQNRKLDVGNTETLPEHDDDSTDTDSFGSEYDSDYKTSLERCFREIVSVTDSRKISAPKLDASLLEGDPEAGSSAAEYESDHETGSEMYYRDAVILIDSCGNPVPKFDSSLSEDQTAIGSSATEYDSDGEANSEKSHEGVITRIDSSDSSMPILHPSLLNILPPVEGSPGEDESDYETSSDAYFGEVLTLQERQDSMSELDPAFLYGKTEVEGPTTEKQNDLIGETTTHKSDSYFDKEGRTSFDKDMAGSERHEKFKEIGLNKNRMFQLFESF